MVRLLGFETAETLEVSMFIVWGMRWPSKQDICSTCRHCRKRSGFKDGCFDPIFNGEVKMSIDFLF